MTKRATHGAIRAWASGGELPPADAWAGCDDAGFGALHALAEEEDAEGSQPARFAKLCSVAAARGSAIHSGDLLIGHTPLNWCSWHAAPGCASALLAAGADPRARNRNGETPAEVARRLLAPASSMRPERAERLRCVLALLESARERGDLDASCACPAQEARHAGRL